LQAKEFAQRFGTDRSHPRTIPFGRTLLAHLVTFRRKFSLAHRSPFGVWRLAFGGADEPSGSFSMVDPLRTLELPSGRDAHSQTTPRWRRSAVSECLILPPVVYSPIYLLGSPLGRRRAGRLEVRPGSNLDRRRLINFVDGPFKDRVERLIIH
jgi:hypothetical protein